MTTEKQAEANRLNSQNSTGPRSAEGKTASSRNALKSGIYSNAQIIRGEDATNLELLKSEYFTHYRPTNPEQRMLLDLMIDSEWLLRRFRMVEAQLWEEGALDHYKPNDDVILAQSYNRHEERFARLQRRIDAAVRNFRHASQELKRLQAEEPPAPEREPIPVTPSEQTPSAENGFVPQPDSETPVDAEPPKQFRPLTIPFGNYFTPRKEN